MGKYIEKKKKRGKKDNGNSPNFLIFERYSNKKKEGRGGEGSG